VSQVPELAGERIDVALSVQSSIFIKDFKVRKNMNYMLNFFTLAICSGS